MDNITTGKNALTHKWWILANVSVGTFMATLDGSIANVALPTMSHTLGVPLYLVQWVVTAYLLTICAMLPIVGKLSDMLGRNRLYSIGFLVFATGSALCGLSNSIDMLIAMRIIQGIGASLLMANSQAIVAGTFPPQERGRALGITGTMVSVGSLTGPAIGGILVGAWGWPSIFWINVPIGIIGFLAALRIMAREPIHSQHEPFDYLGSITFMGGIVSLLYTISNAETWGWSSLSTVIGLVLAVVLLLLFFLREKGYSFPMLDLSLFSIRAFRNGTLAAMLSFISLFCTTIMMPFYMQGVLHFSPSETGFVMVANPLVTMVVAPISGWLSDKIGSLWLTTTGLMLNAIGFVLLTLLSAHTSAFMVGLQLAVFGIGQGMFQSPNNSSVMGSVPLTKLGIAGGVNALVRNIGMVLGISLSVSLFSYRIHVLTGSVAQIGVTAVAPQAFMNALHTVFWAAAVVCLIGVVVSARRNGGNLRATGLAK